MLAPWKESYDKPSQHIKKQRHHFVDKDQYSQSYGLSSSHVWVWELDYKESWALKNWCFWTVVVKTLVSPLDSKETKRINPKGNQYWIFIGRTDAEAEAPILWPPDVKSWLIWKDPDAGKQENGMIEDEMVGWHHWLNGHEFEQALVDGEGQGGLACCSPWGCKELDTTEQLNNSLIWRWHFTALIDGQGPDFEPAKLTLLNTFFVLYCTIHSHTCYLPSQQALILFPVSSFFSTLGWMAHKS